MKRQQGFSRWLVPIAVVAGTLALGAVFLGDSRHRQVQGELESEISKTRAEAGAPTVVSDSSPTATGLSADKSLTPPANTTDALCQSAATHHAAASTGAGVQLHPGLPQGAYVVRESHFSEAEDVCYFVLQNHYVMSHGDIVDNYSLEMINGKVLRSVGAELSTRFRLAQCTVVVSPQAARFPNDEGPRSEKCTMNDVYRGEGGALTYRYPAGTEPQISYEYFGGLIEQKLELD